MQVSESKMENKDGRVWEWTKEKTVELIAEYRKRRGLWDMTHEDYRKKNVKRQLSAEVRQIIDETGQIPVSEIEKKFHTLRTQYHRELSRTKRSDPYSSKWFAYKHLDFLSSPKACRTPKGVKGKPGVTNYIIKQSPSEVGSPSTSQNASVTTEIVIQRKPPYLQRSLTKSEHDTRRARDLEKLIEETTKDVEEPEDVKKNFVIKEITLEANPHQPYSSTASVEIEHEHPIADETEIMEADELEQSIESEHEGHISYSQNANLIKMHGAVQRRNEIEEHYFDEEHHHQIGSVNKFETPPKINSNRFFDECSTYGEYVANEMRPITSREILQTLKHKINTALYEASMAQLHK